MAKVRGKSFHSESIAAPSKLLKEKNKAVVSMKPSLNSRINDSGIGDSDSNHLRSCSATTVPGSLNSIFSQDRTEDNTNPVEVRRPLNLPKFRHPRTCIWTSSHEANCPSEDRSSSLVNILLQSLPPNFASET